MPEPFMVPQGPLPSATYDLAAPSEMRSFPALFQASAASQPMYHPERIILQIAESPTIQQQLSMPTSDIKDILGKPWTVENALANSIELPAANLIRSTSKRSLTLSPMKGSSHSVDRHDGPTTWGVDVEGLREALGKHTLSG
jgi:hypothetical protein